MIFAIYSTADTENPTLLYASTGDQATAEVNALKSFLEEYRNADTGTETFGSWVETYGLQRSPDGIYRYQSVHSGNANSDDGLDVRTSERKPSAAYESCLRNIAKRVNNSNRDNGAAEYAEKYIENREMGKTTRASAYREMAKDELRHAGNIYGYAIEDIEAIKKVYSMSPEAEEMWEHELKHYADCVAKIGMMLS